MAFAALVPAVAGLAQSMLAAYGSKQKPGKPNYKKLLTDPSKMAGTDFTGLKSAMLSKLSQNAGEGMRQGQMNLEAAGVRGADAAANVRGVQSRIAEGQGAIEADIMDRILQSKLEEMDRNNRAIEAENAQMAADYGIDYNEYAQDRAERSKQFNEGLANIGSGIGGYFSDYEDRKAKIGKYSPRYR